MYSTIDRRSHIDKYSHSMVVHHTPLYETDCCEPCSVYSSCNNCMCNGFQSETILIPGHIPRVYYRPISKRIICCAPAKPKRHFWQQLFGNGRKCRCTPACCKACFVKGDYDCSPSCVGAFRPICWCKSTTDQRELCPTSRSDSGQQFNTGKDIKQNQGPKGCDCQGVKNNSATEEKVGLVNIGTNTNTDKEGIQDNDPYKKERKISSSADSGTSHQENKGDKRESKSSSNGQDTSKAKWPHQDRAVQTQSIGSKGSTDVARDTSSNSNICIGITFTKEQVQYCKPQDGMTHSSESEVKNPERVELNVGCRSYDTNVHNTGKPKSERLGHKWSGQDDQIRSLSKRNSLRFEENGIHRTVSEIFKKLLKIEEKLGVIEKKGIGLDGVKKDLDAQNSPVPVYLKDLKHKKRSKGNNYSKNRNCQSSTTVIEIRHARSKSCSYENKTSTSLATQRRSLSLGRHEEKKRSNPKVIVKVANRDGNDSHHTTWRNNYRNCEDQNAKQDYSSWSEVLNNLKLESIQTKCYCLECIIQRNQNLYL
uniref:Uncharacterized protein n=1 Tax=Graphocephala atropunctata TaxID=36148 RepID=A0A1B6MU31_9HEMI